MKRHALISPNESAEIFHCLGIYLRGPSIRYTPIRIKGYRETLLVSQKSPASKAGLDRQLGQPFGLAELAIKPALHAGDFCSTQRVSRSFFPERGLRPRSGKK